MIVRSLVFTGVLSMAGCAANSGSESEQQKLDLYRQYAGPPVDHIASLYNYGGLTALGPRNALFWAGIDQPYLITVNTPCGNLRFADGIGLTHHESTDSVYARFDSLIVDGIHCTIAAIQPIDYARLKQDGRTATLFPSARAGHLRAQATP